MQKLLVYFLNRLRESTTWIGILVSTLGIPQKIHEPITQIILGAIAVAMVLVKEGQSGDSPEHKSLKGENSS